MTSRVKMSSQQFHTVTNNKIWLTKKSLTNLQIPEDHWQMTETVNCHFRCCLRKDWRSYFRFRCLRSCCHCLRSCCWCYWSCIGQSDQELEGLPKLRRAECEMLVMKFTGGYHCMSNQPSSTKVNQHVQSLKRFSTGLVLVILATSILV